jgi:hypothetical protein
MTCSGHEVEPSYHKFLRTQKHLRLKVYALSETFKSPAGSPESTKSFTHHATENLPMQSAFERRSPENKEREEIFLFRKLKFIDNISHSFLRIPRRRLNNDSRGFRHIHNFLLSLSRSLDQLIICEHYPLNS